MLIVCTQDLAIVNFALNQRSGSAAWGQVSPLAAGTQAAATHALRLLVRQLGPGEALCLSAHGNDTSIGDAGPGGWTWTAADLATIFAAEKPNYAGEILISACAQNIANMAPRLAIALEALGVCAGTCIYSYNRAIGVQTAFPDPALLDQQVDLQPAVVN